MTYHDDIITITLCRGELAVSLGERGYMTRNWGKLAAVLERELRRETRTREDGHTGSSAVGDLLIERILELHENGDVNAGVTRKPDEAGHRDECWPFGQKWFDGEGGK